MSDALRRAIRSAAQLVASGGLTALIDKLVGGMDPMWIAVVMAVWQVVVTYAHNWLEDNTHFPALLKSPPSPGINPAPPDAS